MVCLTSIYFTLFQAESFHIKTKCVRFLESSCTMISNCMRIDLIRSAILQITDVLYQRSTGDLLTACASFRRVYSAPGRLIDCKMVWLGRATPHESARNDLHKRLHKYHSITQIRRLEPPWLTPLDEALRAAKTWRRRKRRADAVCGALATIAPVAPRLLLCARFIAPRRWWRTLNICAGKYEKRHCFAWRCFFFSRFFCYSSYHYH